MQALIQLGRRRDRGMLAALAVGNTLSKVALAYTMGWFVNAAIARDMRRLLVCGAGALLSLLAIYVLTMASTRLQVRIAQAATLRMKRAVYAAQLFDQRTATLNADALLNLIHNKFNL